MRSKSLKDYRVVIASNSNERDGIGIEVQDNTKEVVKILIDIFRDDENDRYTITLFEENLPLELIEESIESFKKEIPSEFQK
jgi:hypothetical protein